MDSRVGSGGPVPISNEPLTGVHVSGKDPLGLIQLVLTVWFLVLVLLARGSRASSGSARLCPRASICFMAPSSRFSDLLPLAPRPPMQKQDEQETYFQGYF